MDKFEESYEAWKAGSREQEHASVLLQDVYEFLEMENRHIQIEVLEQMTGKKYEQVYEFIKVCYYKYIKQVQGNLFKSQLLRQ